MMIWLVPETNLSNESNELLETLKMVENCRKLINIRKKPF